MSFSDLVFKQKKNPVKQTINLQPIQPNNILLLEHKIPANQEFMLRERKLFETSKASGKEFFQIAKLCMACVQCKIILAKKLSAFPYHKRGTKGFLLEPAAITLFPQKIQEAYALNNEKFGTRLVLLGEIVIALPPTDYKLKRK